MDKLESASTKKGSKKTWEKRTEFEDGSYEIITVEEVENGFIKSTTRHYKDDEEWEYECKKTIHTENPMEEGSAISVLKQWAKENL